MPRSRRRRRGLALALLLAGLSTLQAACGDSITSQTAKLAAIPQPTPDPTLDAVVRNLPRALAGATATPSPAPAPVVVRRQPAASPTPGHPSAPRGPDGNPPPARKPAPRR